MTEQTVRYKFRKFISSWGPMGYRLRNDRLSMRYTLFKGTKQIIYVLTQATRYQESSFYPTINQS